MKNKRRSRGYSLDLYKAIHAADPMHIGVQLGRMCVDKSIPVSQVAHDLNVSRLTIYSWFTGKTYPKPEKVPRMAELLAVYAAQSV